VNVRGDSDGGWRVNPDGADDAIDAPPFADAAVLLSPVVLDAKLAELGVISPIGMTLVALSDAVAMLA
jgi:hypothetical protein